MLEVGVGAKIEAESDDAGHHLNCEKNIRDEVDDLQDVIPWRESHITTCLGGKITQYDDSTSATGKRKMDTDRQ